MGPGSKLQELILDGQRLVPQLQLSSDESSLERNFKRLLSAVGCSESMKTLSLAGCSLSHSSLRVIGKKLFTQDKPCTLTTLVLSDNFNENSARKFLTSAAHARCLENLNLGHSVKCNAGVNAALLALASQVKTLCHVTISADGDAGLPLQVRQQLEANRRQRLASAAMETVLCLQQRFAPPELLGVIAELIFDVQ